MILSIAAALVSGSICALVLRGAQLTRREGGEVSTLIETTHWIALALNVGVLLVAVL